MYDKSILAKSTGASLGVVAVVGMLFLSTGTAFAAPVAGIGGFSIQADSIEGNNLILYPGTGDAENQQLYPHGIVELSQAEISNLRLTKTFDLSQYGFNGKARLVITAGQNSNVTADSLLLKTPELSADKATFNGLVIDESYTTQNGSVANVLNLEAAKDPSVTTRSNIQLDGGSGPGLALQQANIRATYLATNQITLPNLALQVQFSPDGDNNYEFAG